MDFIFSKKKVMSLEEVTTLLGNLRIPTALVFTPINLEVEKKKFFNSDTYNPVFEYRIVKNNNAEILKKLSKVKEIGDTDPRISDFYIQLIDSKREANDLMYAVGNNESITDISVHRYGKPGDQLFRNAARVLRGKMDSYNVVKSDSIRKNDLLHHDEIVRIFNTTFEELGLEGWSVNDSINIAKNGVKVGVKKKEILVDPNIERTRFKLRKTLVHEVGTHALRAYNGLKCGIDALSNANLPEYLDVEEGLATWNENNMGLLTDKWLKKKAALTWAIYLGEDLSFRELYNVLLAVLPKYSAFDITYRVKRGLGDTHDRGIYSKDIAYFRGFRKVKKKLEENPRLYNQLYAGKITFKQCEWVEDGLLPAPTNVPTKEKWLEIFKKAGI
jgi:hypothetical protein